MNKESIFLKIAHSTKEWIAYIDSLQPPKDDFDRTKYHYECTYLYNSKKEMIIYQIISLLLFPISLLCTAVISLFKRKKEKIDCLIMTGGNYINVDSIDSIMPVELYEKFKVIKKIHLKKRRVLLFTGILSFEIIKLTLISICRNPLNFELNFSVFTHLLTVNKYIKLYNPKAIITFAGENDFSSSLITYYCEKYGVEYICIMHGEYFLTPYHAFVRFSKFYVWNELYIYQFLRTGSPLEMFLVYEPKRFKMEIQKSNEEYYVGYYLQDFNEQQMLSIRNNLRKLVMKGYKCKVRPHKRATDLTSMNKIFQKEKGIDIEDTTISIKESFENCKYIVSIYSTVISEALYNGLSVLIDDISDKDLYSILNDIMYINIDRVSGRFSDII